MGQKLFNLELPSTLGESGGPQLYPFIPQPGFTNSLPTRWLVGNGVLHMSLFQNTQTTIVWYIYEKNHLEQCGDLNQHSSDSQKNLAVAQAGASRLF